ncbi:MAG: transcription repressor NadR [Eubacteriales bacterium]|nr:transcription repressor NadR [Eubacteriales bacterium]
MDGAERRKKIIELLEKGAEPYSGTALARKFGVSRQVIVQDIALLRATDKNILSTNKGYIIFGEKEKNSCKRIVFIKHTDGQMKDEMYTIVDAGARILDVIVEHEVYGQIAADLMITSRKDVDDFMRRIFAVKGKPLKELTGDEHYHTIEADREEILDEVERGLKEKGYLLTLGE